MRNSENGPAQRNHITTALQIAGITAIAILLLICIWLSFIKDRFSLPISPTPTNKVEPSATSTISTPATPTITPFATPTIGISITPTIESFDTPSDGIKGINLPDGFSVGPWHDNSIKCDKNPKHYLVKIYGVEISGGTPPYEITFWQSDKKILTTTAIFFERFVVFLDPVRVIDPVEVIKGEYAHVTITFQSPNGESKWIDDLLYPYRNDPKCKG